MKTLWQTFLEHEGHKLNQGECIYCNRKFRKRKSSDITTIFATCKEAPWYEYLQFNSMGSILYLDHVSKCIDMVVKEII